MLPTHRPTNLIQHIVHSRLRQRLPGIILGVIIGFATTLVAHAEEPTACGFGLLQCNESGIVWDVSTIGVNNLAQLSSSDGLAEAILAFGYFLNRIIVPFLMAVALVLFLYYIARSFIIDAAYTDKREEANKRALWGLAAFIVIASIWGVVNLFVNGLDIDQDRSFCPDYLGNWCGDLGGYGGESNINFGNPSNFDVTLGGIDGSGNDGTLPQPSNSSALGELLFGAYEDSASFNFRAGLPRASESVVALSPNMSCADGLNALQTSAHIETLQSGYLLYRNEDDQVRWLNITDGTSETSITYDADTIQSYVTQSGESNVALIHTHPHATIKKLKLPMSGYGPSVSDMKLMCDDVVNDARFVTVDANNVWVLESTSATCPRRSREMDALPVISALIQVALLEPKNRESSLEQMLQRNELPTDVRQGMGDYANTNFANLTSTDILLLADNLAREGGFKITRQTVDDFCATF